MLQKTRKSGDPTPTAKLGSKTKAAKSAPDIDAVLAAAEAVKPKAKAKPKPKQSSGCGCGW